MTENDLNGVVMVLESLEWFPEASRPTGVLVVSKNLDTRLLLANFLENRGYGVWTAGCGEDAYQVGIEHPVAIDVLVCDENVPDLTVADLFGRLKTRLPGLRCCVLATTKQRLRANEAARLGAVVVNWDCLETEHGEPVELASGVRVW